MAWSRQIPSMTELQKRIHKAAEECLEETAKASLEEIRAQIDRNNNYSSSRELLAEQAEEEARAGKAS